jgi:trimeric autotransporter adhesin
MRTLVLVAIILVRGLSAQQSGTPTRIKQTIDETKRSILKGNTHPLAQPQFDRGAAPSNLPLDRILLVLRRSQEQETALQSLLRQQQDKDSHSYVRG